MEVCDTCGCPVFTGNGRRRLDPELPNNALYYPLNPVYEPVRLRMIPYHTFANRDETNMIVYLGY